jgi:copper transport protein
MTGLLRHRWRALILAAAIAGPLLPVGAAAHPYLVSSDPAAEATVPTSPGHITIFYTEELDGPYSSVSLVGPDGQQESTQRSAAITWWWREGAGMKLR